MSVEYDEETEKTVENQFEEESISMQSEMTSKSLKRERKKSEQLILKKLSTLEEMNMNIE